jgi:uncharacterized membrane protein
VESSLLVPIPATKASLGTPVTSGEGVFTLQIAALRPAAALSTDVGFRPMSRRWELGLATFWIDIFDLGNSPSLPSILLLGFALLTFFICWETAAEWLYIWLFGPAVPESLYAFFIEVFTTSQGWTLIIFGHAIGFVLAVAVLSISVSHSRCSSTAMWASLWRFTHLSERCWRARLRWDFGD